MGGSVHPPPSGCHVVERKEVYERERTAGELAAGKWKRWAATGHLVQDNAQEDFYIQTVTFNGLLMLRIYSVLKG